MYGFPSERCYSTALMVYVIHIVKLLDLLSNVDKDERHLQNIISNNARINFSHTYFDIFHFLVHEHNFNQEVLGMRGDRLLADMLYQFAELHRQPLSALKNLTE